MKGCTINPYTIHQLMPDKIKQQYIIQLRRQRKRAAKNTSKI